MLLDPDLPVRARDLVELGIDGRRLGIPLKSSAKRARVEELLAAVDGLALLDARVGALSGGEQQKVLIAHVLARHPRLLLLDEPLANLDLHSTQETVTLLGRISREQGVAILLSTHDMNPLLPVMSRVIYLAGGRAATGTADEVVRSDVLSRPLWPPRRRLPFPWPGHRLVGEEHREEGCEPGPEEECGPEPRHPRAAGAPLASRRQRGLAPAYERLARRSSSAGFFGTPAVQTAGHCRVVVACVCAPVGVFTVIRGQSFAGHAFADITSTGGSAAFVAGINPLIGFAAMGLPEAGPWSCWARTATAAGTSSPASCSGRGLGLSALFLYLSTTSGSTTGAAVTVLFGSIFAVSAGPCPWWPSSAPWPWSSSASFTGPCC